jgi:hypothetical protein
VDKRANLRASDEDRDRIVAQLHKAAIEGRIASEELEQRVSDALTAKTYGELDATVADLPGQAPRRRAGRPEVSQRSAAGWAVTVVRHNPMLLLFALPVVAVTAAMVLAMTIVWAVLMVVVMVLGGRPRAPRAPWAYTRYARGRYSGPPGGRRPRSYWA